MTENCPLCHPEGETVLVSNQDFRVIRVNDPQFPGYYRIIWKEHVKEMSGLSDEKRAVLWRALMKVEEAVLREMAPEKVNLAEFGTMVPHLHWHIIPRYKDDPSYPDSYWSERKREVAPEVLEERRRRERLCDERIKDSFR